MSKISTKEIGVFPSRSSMPLSFFSVWSFSDVGELTYRNDECYNTKIYYYARPMKTRTDLVGSGKKLKLLEMYRRSLIKRGSFPKNKKPPKVPYKKPSKQHLNYLVKMYKVATQP